MTYISRKRAIGIKIESTPYTAESLTAGQYNFPAFDIGYTPEIESLVRNYSTADFSKFSSIMGKRKLEVQFSVHLAASNTANVAPAYAPALKACALLETVHTSGVEYVTDADESSTPITIQIQEVADDTSAESLFITGKGMMGNPQFILDDVGQPFKAVFNMTGALQSIATGAFLDPSFTDTTDPDAVLSATLSIFSENEDPDNITIDLANQVELYKDLAQGSGYRGAYVVDRSPSININPYLKHLATSGHFGRWTAGTEGAFTAIAGSGDSQVSLLMPKYQIVKAYDGGDREGFSSHSIEAIANRSSGDDEFKLLFGSDS
jgi:hypothetical protein